MKLDNMIFMENRVQEGSSQVYIEDKKIDADVFYTPIADDKSVIGYLKFEKAGTIEGCFQLVSLENQDYPNPYPQFSLSGVLYSRKEALLSHQLMTSYVQGLNPS